jgi:hypothetical protein
MGGAVESPGECDFGNALMGETSISQIEQAASEALSLDVLGHGIVFSSEKQLEVAGRNPEPLSDQLHGKLRISNIGVDVRLQQIATESSRSVGATSAEWRPGTSAPQ